MNDTILTNKQIELIKIQAVFEAFKEDRYFEQMFSPSEYKQCYADIYLKGDLIVVKIHFIDYILASLEKDERGNYDWNDLKDVWDVKEFEYKYNQFSKLSKEIALALQEVADHEVVRKKPSDEGFYDNVADYSELNNY